MTETQQPEALRLAECLERDTKMNWPDYDNQVDAAKELRRLHARVVELEAMLVKESGRTADQKLRADQMSQQHDTQAALNREARAQLAAQQERKPLTPKQVKEVSKDAGYWDEGANDLAIFINGIRHGERAHGIKETQE